MKVDVRMRLELVVRVVVVVQMVVRRVSGRGGARGRVCAARRARLGTTVGCVYFINRSQADAGNAAVVVIPCERTTTSTLALVSRSGAGRALDVFDPVGHAL